MIIGIGVDMVDITRIGTLLQKKGEAFAYKCFTESERLAASALTHPHRRAAFYAKRFAAKEAVAKAFGTGIGAVIGWQDIEISRKESAAPAISLSESALSRLREQGIMTKKCKIHLSLSDERHYALAYVVVESAEDV